MAQASEVKRLLEAEAARAAQEIAAKKPSTRAAKKTAATRPAKTVAKAPAKRAPAKKTTTQPAKSANTSKRGADMAAAKVKSPEDLINDLEASTDTEESNILQAAYVRIAYNRLANDLAKQRRLLDGQPDAVKAHLSDLINAPTTPGAPGTPADPNTPATTSGELPTGDTKLHAILDGKGGVTLINDYLPPPNNKRTFDLKGFTDNPVLAWKSVGHDPDAKPDKTGLAKFLGFTSQTKPTS